MTWREEILWSAPAERLAATALWLPAQPIPYLLRRLLARVAAQTASPRAAQSTRNTCALSVGIKLGFQIPVMLWCASMRASSTSVLRRVGFCQKRVYNARNSLPSEQNGYVVSACGLDAGISAIFITPTPGCNNSHLRALAKLFAWLQFQIAPDLHRLVNVAHGDKDYIVLRVNCTGGGGATHLLSNVHHLLLSAALGG